MKRKLLGINIYSFICVFSVSSIGFADDDATLTSGRGKRTTSLGLRVDCMQDHNIDKGRTQPCFRVSGLRVRHVEVLNKNLSALIQLDPFATLNSSENKFTYRASAQTTANSRFPYIDRYAFVWSPKVNMDIAIEEYSGAAYIPDVSELSLGSAFDSGGWDQTALSATYHLPAGQGMRVKFVLGNGEGENGDNLDPQQYFGFEVKAEPLAGIEGNIGVSFDGNNVGSDRFEWQLAEFEKCGLTVPTETIETGYSTRRIALGGALNGKLSYARGLKIGFGWQKVTMSDLNKSKPSAPTPSELAGCETLDPANIFIEDPTGQEANTVQHSVYGINGSYRILDTYFVGFDFENRTVDTGTVDFFEPCESFVGTSCQTRIDAQNKLTQTSYSVGFGMDIRPELRLVLEYNELEYDQPYNKFHFVGTAGDASQSWAIFNARIMYNWM